MAIRRDGLWSLEQGVGADEYAESDARSVTIVCALVGLDERAIGHVQYDPLTRRLRQMLVMPQFRRLGVGRALVQRVVAVHEARMAEEAGRDAKRPKLEDGTSPQLPRLRVHAHLRSVQFYERVGFSRLLAAGVEHELDGGVYVSNGVECVKLEYRGQTAG